MNLEKEIMVSVICPTYNQGQYMRQGLDSILNQETDFEIEILIGEDCSPDNTNEILAEYEEKFPGRLQVFHREQNLKQSKNVYDLFMRSKGKYIIILDLDDYWTDVKKLQKQVDFLEAHPEYIGVAHDCAIINAEGKIVEEHRIKSDFLNKPFTLQNFLDNGFIHHTGTFCYRNIWKESQDWSVLYEADEMVVDMTINSILLLRKDIFILPDRMSVYRKVLDVNANNCCSVARRDIGKRWMQSARQFAVLTEYFQGEIDYSRMWSYRIIWYLKALLKREKGSFSWKNCWKMWNQANSKTRKKVRKELRTSFYNQLIRKR